MGIGGGMVVFEGEFITNGGYGRGRGLYAVPVGGGAITILVDTNTAIPDSSGNFNFTNSGETFTDAIIGRVSVRGTQVFFASSGGIYSVPATGGTITRFGDSSMTIVDLSLNQFDPDGYPNNTGQSVDLGGGVVAFLARAASNPYSCDAFVAPATGLTVGANGYVNNAELIVSPSTPAPGLSGNFDTGDVSVFVDDSGTPVVFASPEGGLGLYAFAGSTLTTLAVPGTAVPGTTGTLGSIASGGPVSGGVAYFTAYTSGADSGTGIFSVPVLTGALTTVVSTANQVPGLSGVLFNNLQLTPGGVSGGKVVFAGMYATGNGGTNPTGLYLATPGAAVTTPAGSQLLLNTHTGGDTGQVTLTATIIPGAPALVSGATAKLSASGLSDITAKTVIVNAEGIALTATFDLGGQADGVYDLVITNPDGSTDSQASTFTVEPGQGANVYGDLLGRYYLRAGKPQPYTILVGNSGDVDAAAVPIFLKFPNAFQAQVSSVLVTPSQPPGLPEPIDFTQVPSIFTDGDQNVLPVILTRVPAGGIDTIQILFTVPDVPQYAHVDFNLDVAVGEPWVDAETDDLAAAGSPQAQLGDNGKHIEMAGAVYTCVAGFLNVAIDCGGLFNPAVGEATQAAKCLKNTAAYVVGSTANLTSDNTEPIYSAVEGGQVLAGGVFLLTNCAGVIPGVNTVVNAINCGIDTFLLYDNCIRPNIVEPIQTIVSGDPNDLDGSLGDGSAAHYLTGSQPLRYIVSFENEDTASAPAQSVTITNPLDANLDLSTFRPRAHLLWPHAAHPAPPAARTTRRPWTCARRPTCWSRSRPRSAPPAACCRILLSRSIRRPSSPRPTRRWASCPRTPRPRRATAS